MNQIKKNERILAYETAQVIKNEDLKQISGGGSGTTEYSTKQTCDTRGNCDVGGDVRWD